MLFLQDCLEAALTTVTGEGSLSPAPQAEGGTDFAVEYMLQGPPGIRLRRDSHQTTPSFAFLSPLFHPLLPYGMLLGDLQE